MERHDISEEQMQKNGEVFAELTKGVQVRIECYRAFHDVTVTGTVSSIDMTFQYLVLGTEKFFFRDIYEIEIIDYLQV